MIRQLMLATLAAFALGGCATDYAYRGGAGDYYYGQPSVVYHDYYGYSAPYGSLYGYGYPYWRSGLSIGYGYGYGYYGHPYRHHGGYYGGYPFYYYPWYWRWRGDDRHDEPPPSGPERVTGGRLPPSRVDGGPPRSGVGVMPRTGGGSLQLPPDRAWRDRGAIERPRLSRPAPRAIHRPDRSRVETGSRPTPPPVSRPAPQVVRPPTGGRAAPQVHRPAPRASRPAPRTSRPSNARSRSPSPLRERVQEE